MSFEPKSLVTITDLKTKKVEVLSEFVIVGIHKNNEKNDLVVVTAVSVNGLQENVLILEKLAPILGTLSAKIANVLETRILPSLEKFLTAEKEQDGKTLSR